MSLLFGEIVEPSTRAFWDDYDEYEEMTNDQIVIPEWKWTNKKEENVYPKCIKLFIIIEGIGIKKLIDSTILNNKSPTCHLLKHNVAIYEFPEYCICLSEERELNNFGLLTVLVQKWIDVSNELVAITLQSQVTHKGHDVNIEEECFIRGINSKLKHVKELEVPNFITGIAAGVVSLRQFLNLPASCYIVYMKHSIFDSISTTPIIKLMKEIGLKCNDSSFIKIFTDPSNLYL